MPAQGQQVRILTGEPAKIEADRYIVGFSTGRDLLSKTAAEGSRHDRAQLSKLNIWGEHVAGLNHHNAPRLKLSTPVSPAKTILCHPPLDDLAKAARTPQQMFHLIRNAIGDETGAIVIEPQPDRMEDGEPVCSDEGLTEQIRATLVRKSDAQAKGLDRMIAFVSPDEKLLNRIQTLHTQLIEQQQRAHPDDASRFRLDSESDSDTDAGSGSEIDM